MSRNLTLCQFTPEAVEKRRAEEEEDRKIMSLLGRFSAEMLLEGLQENYGHPKPEWGEGESWRSYYIAECKRRGFKLLQGLGWPSAGQAPYRNIHTGDRAVLKEILSTYMSWGGSRNPGKHLWTLVEHWEPVDPENNEKIEVIENEREEKGKESQVLCRF